jgi:hypothetical protein
MAKGTEDAEWISKLEQELGWVVITADRGKDPKSPKLPILCVQFKITHVLITPSLMQAGYSVQKQALLTVWQQIVRLPQVPKGTRAELGYRMFNQGFTKAAWLSIGGKHLDIWCHEHGIEAPN